MEDGAMGGNAAGIAAPIPNGAVDVDRKLKMMEDHKI